MSFAKLKSWIACRNPQHCTAKLLVVVFISLWIIPAEREWVLEHLGRLTGDKTVVGSWHDWDTHLFEPERSAYNFAHAIKLPDSLPKPVPFNFTRHLLSSRATTSRAYFDHLCKTEAGEYIFKTVDKVEGLYQMRPMPKRTEALMQDRYGFEDPADWSQGEADGSPTLFIGGPGNGFVYFESSREPKEIVNPVNFGRWHVRLWEWDKPGAPPYWKYFDYDYTNSRSGPTVVPEETINARYGYTWRGIRRERDREFGIAGGEMMVLDLQTNEVLAVRRSFAIAKMYRSAGLNWEFAYFCPGSLDYVGRQKREVNKIAYPFEFIRQVLNPINFDTSKIRH